MMNYKKFVVSVILGVSFCGTAFAGTQVVVNVDSNSNAVVQTAQTQNTHKEVAWEATNEAFVVEVGQGFPGKFQGTQGRLMARRAAIVDCYRNLVARIQAVQVDSESTVENMMAVSDVVRTKITGSIKGAKIIDEGMEEDGAYWVKMSVPMFGNNSVAAAVMPEVMKTTPIAEPPAVVTPKTTAMTKQEFKEIKQEVKSAGYSGIVIDAGGKGLECTMAPQILDTNGRAVYGKENIDIDFAVSNGLVEYSKDLSMATSGSSRAGNNPLVIKATGVRGGTNSVNPVNVVVSPEDADKILLAAQNNPNMFKNGAVVFVR